MEHLLLNYSGLLYLDPDDVRSLSMEATWNFSEEPGLL